MSNPSSSFLRGRSSVPSSNRPADRSSGPSSNRPADRSSGPSSSPSVTLTGPSAMNEDIRVVFFLPMLDEVIAEEWYFKPGVVPLIPRKLDKLIEAYLPPLQHITGSPLNQAGKVQKVYAHLGIGGFFEFNPKSNVFRDCTQHQFEILLRRLLQDRELVEPGGTGVMIAREIKTTREVDALYADLRDNYYKIGCVSGPKAVYERSLYDRRNYGINDNASLMFLFGDHVDFMNRSQLVDTFALVSEYEMESYCCVSKVVELVAQRRGIL